MFIIFSFHLLDHVKYDFNANFFNQSDSLTLSIKFIKKYKWVSMQNIGKR